MTYRAKEPRLLRGLSRPRPWPPGAPYLWADPPMLETVYIGELGWFMLGVELIQHTHAPASTPHGYQNLAAEA